MGILCGLIVAGVILWAIGITHENAGIISGVGGFITKFLVDNVYSNIQKKKVAAQETPKQQSEEELPKQPE